MAVVEPYAPCPCGSGQKFKWCCHRVEAYAERADRLFASGQIEGALGALDEGLRKEPDNAWLLTRKAVYLTRAGHPEEAKAAVLRVLAKNPKHAGAQVLMTRLVLETEGPVAGAGQLQQALTAVNAAGRASLAGLVKVVGAFLSEAGEAPAALKHLGLARDLDGDREDESLASTISVLEGNPGVSAWQKNPDALSAAPEGLTGEARARFVEALGWASEGLWSSAAAAFETLTGDPDAGRDAGRNLGLCRLWLADNSGAVRALRRYASTLGPTAEAVDVEALCQQVAPLGRDAQVEQVQLVWPLRNRETLLAALGADPSVHPEEPGPIDADDPESPEVDSFALLDRPAVKAAAPGLKPGDVPRIVGRVLVGQEIVALETYDDGRLDRLAERFTTLAGSSVPPAHPKTKVLGRVPRLQLALVWEWLLPEGVDPAESRRLTEAQGVHLLREVWPNTPHPALGGRTPLKAAEAGDSRVPLRAAVLQFEQSGESWRDGFDFAGLRSMLEIDPEPEIDPEGVDVGTLHLARLGLLPANRLSDESLGTLYQRSQRYALDRPLANAVFALVERPEAMRRLGIASQVVYSEAAALAAGRGKTDEAFDWIQRGRQADAPADRARNAPGWDMLEIRFKARTEEPEIWVPEIAVVLDRYRDDSEATTSVMMHLVQMGLLQMVRVPDRPGEVMLDSRPLQALLAEYGPRVTTSTGRLGVSATKPEIWTPGGAAGGAPGGLWTPGSGGGGPAGPPPAGGGGGGKNLIIPGR